VKTVDVRSRIDDLVGGFFKVKPQREREDELEVTEGSGTVQQNKVWPTRKCFIAFDSKCFMMLFCSTALMINSKSKFFSVSVDRGIGDMQHTLSGTTRVSQYQKDQTRKVKPIWIYWSKR